jgi:hypothetical protein
MCKQVATAMASDLREASAMTESERPGNAYLHALRDGKQVIATAVREQRTTPRRGAGFTHWWIALILAACGGGSKSDTYAKGTHVLEECCEHVQGGGRDKCLAEIPRVEDQGAAKTATNQQTYACIVDHFTCDPATGHATQPSAQAQYDCIEDLQ